MQLMNKPATCEVLPDGVIRCSHAALNDMICGAEEEQRAQAAADPHSPTQSMLLQADPQLHPNGHVSPQQRQEAQEQQQEAQEQHYQQHMLHYSALHKVTN